MLFAKKLGLGNFGASSWLAAVSALLPFVPPAGAAPTDEFYIRQALDRYYVLPRDARTLSLGENTTATCRGGECANLNPAGLGFLTHYEVLGGLSRGRIQGKEFIEQENVEQLEDRGYITGTIPLGEDRDRGPQYGNLALGYSRYAGDTDDVLSTTPDGHRRAAAYGISITPKWAVGYAFTFYDDQLHTDISDLHSHSRILHVLGVQNKFDNDTTLGAMFRLGTGQSDTEDYTLKSDGLSRPHELGGILGIERKIVPGVTGSFSVRYSDLESEGNLSQASSPVFIGSDEEGTTWAVGYGVEIQPIEPLSLRAGAYYESVDYDFYRSDLRHLSGNADGMHWAAGLGYNFNNLADWLEQVRLDYGFAYTPVSGGSWEHLVSFALSF